MTKQHGTLQIGNGGGEFSAYFAVPANSGHVAVVVLQEIFGVNANIRGIVDEFADAGYAAIAPDLFWRKEPGVELDPSSEADRATALDLMKSLNHSEAVSDGAAALKALRERVPGLTSAAAIGYCLGGGVAFKMAVDGAVDAGVSYYGTGLHMMVADMAKLKGRVLLHIAGDDHLCPPEAQAIIKAAADQAGDRAEVVIYPGVGHAFARSGGATFNQNAADQANARTMNLLKSL